MFNKFKKGINDAAKATKRKATATKLKLSIDSCKKKIKKEMRRMGVIYYDNMAEGDMARATNAFQETKQRIEELEGKIAAKHVLLADLEAGKLDPDKINDEHLKEEDEHVSEPKPKPAKKPLPPAPSGGGGGAPPPPSAILPKQLSGGIPLIPPRGTGGTVAPPPTKPPPPVGAGGGAPRKPPPPAAAPAGGGGGGKGGVDVQGAKSAMKVADGTADFNDMKNAAKFANDNKETIKKGANFYSENKESCNKAAGMASKFA